MTLSQFGGYTPAQGRRNRKKLLKELAADARRRHRQTLAKLDKEEADAKKGRQAALAAARQRCTTRIEEARRLAKEHFDKAKADAEADWTAAAERRLAARRAERDAAAELCEVDRKHVEQEETARLEAVQKKKDEEKRYQREMASIERVNKKRDRARPRASAAERRSEADDEVLSNLPEGLHPLWAKIKRGIKGTDRISRLEVFLQHAEEHPDEVLAAQQAAADRELAKLEREYYQGQPKTSARRRATRADLADVPF